MTPTLEHRYTAVQIDGSEHVQTFTYTGSDQTYTVPDGTAQLHVRMWGAGGGGAGKILADPVDLGDIRNQQ